MIEKPPLGCRPYYISASERIKELAEAIARNADRADLYGGHIEIWAYEILYQLAMLKKIPKEVG